MESAIRPVPHDHILPVPLYNKESALNIEDDNSHEAAQERSKFDMHDGDNESMSNNNPTSLNNAFFFLRLWSKKFLLPYETVL